MSDHSDTYDSDGRSAPRTCPGIDEAGGIGGETLSNGMLLLYDLEDGSDPHETDAWVAGNPVPIED